MKWITALLLIGALGASGYYTGQLDMETIIFLSIIGGIFYLPYSLLIDIVYNENPEPFKKGYIYLVSMVILVMFIAKFMFFIFQEL